MTMTRNAKAEALTAHAVTLTKTRVFAISPAQVAIYGSFIPAKIAADLNLSIARDTRTPVRETWARARYGRRLRITRTR